MNKDTSESSPKNQSAKRAETPGITNPKQDKAARTNELLSMVQKAAARRARDEQLPSIKRTESKAVVKGKGWQKITSQTKAAVQPPPPPPPLVVDTRPVSPTGPSEALRKGVRIIKNITAAKMFNMKSGLDPANPLGKNKAFRFKAKKNKRTEEAAMWKVLQQGKNEANGRMALPTAGDLRDLPLHLQQTFVALAEETLSLYLAPRALLWLRKRDRARQISSSTCPKMNLDILTRQELFKNCPQEELRSLIDKLVLAVFEKGEFIIHEGEHSGSGIFFIMTGRVAVYKKNNRKKRSIGPTNGTMLAKLSPVVCVGEFSFLTEEPRMASIQSLTVVECWVLRKNDFNDFVKGLPESTMSSIIECAFSTRNKTMHLAYPISEDTMRKCSIFEPCGKHLLSEYLKWVKPYAVPKSFNVLRGDAKATKILFLQNGKCGVFRGVPKRLNNGDRRLSHTHVHTLRAPCVIGDTSVLHGSPNGDSIMTLSTCDFWVLTREDFLHGLRRNPGIEVHMMAAAREQRQSQLATQQNLFKDIIYDIPFLRDVASSHAMKELVKSFKARVYKPLSVVCSTAEFADRLIVLYKGKIKVGNTYWRKGESVGFTCIVPHKWMQMAVSCEVVECLELGLPQYEAFLKKWGIYSDIAMFAKLLMFPNAFDPELVSVAKQGVADLRTPPFYPISNSTQVRLSEEGFNGMHYRKMIREKEVKKLPVKQWYRVSSYLWKRTPSPPAQPPTSDSSLFMDLRHTGKSKLPMLTPPTQSEVNSRPEHDVAIYL